MDDRYFAIALVMAIGGFLVGVPLSIITHIDWFGIIGIGVSFTGLVFMMIYLIVSEYRSLQSKMEQWPLKHSRQILLKD